ncbi:MAG: glucose-1-phosphate adenylyltransferase subunit GlgD [Oscillospiraceae bacterium]|jgi:glucose-1-phosphate adenylyltransferase|nr:glucose-1-phosphate adenylyltransferase subunit GlgD [Oscillospiraceae bacterium]
MKNENLGIIFSNMHDSALGQLTESRTTSSIPFGGRYRFIDFVLSSMVNSNIYSIGVIAKTNYESLLDHLGSGREWDLARKSGGLYILPPYGVQGAGVYQGKIQALYGMKEYIERTQRKYVVMTDTDVICNIDFNAITEFHKEKEADMTIVYIKKKLSKDVKNATVFSLNGEQRITDVRMLSGSESEQNLSVNIVVAEKDLLMRLVSDVHSHGLYDFDRDILQRRLDSLNIYGYEYKDYFAKIDNLKDYFRANLDLLKPDVRRQLFLSNRNIYTKGADQVPTRYGLDSRITNSLIADGCLIEGEVRNSLISRGVYVGKGALVENSVIMSSCRIEPMARLNYCILDKNALVTNKKILSGSENYPNYIAKNGVV